MVNFSLNLNNDYARPTSMLYGLLTLIDTGDGCRHTGFFYRTVND